MRGGWRACASSTLAFTGGIGLTDMRTLRIEGSWPVVAAPEPQESQTRNQSGARRAAAAWNAN